MPFRDSRGAGVSPLQDLSDSSCTVKKASEQLSDTFSDSQEGA